MKPPVFSLRLCIYDQNDSQFIFHTSSFSSVCCFSGDLDRDREAFFSGVLDREAFFSGVLERDREAFFTGDLERDLDLLLDRLRLLLRLRLADLEPDLLRLRGDRDLLRLRLRLSDLDRDLKHKWLHQCLL